MVLFCTGSGGDARNCLDETKNAEASENQQLFGCQRPRAESVKMDIVRRLVLNDMSPYLSTITAKTLVDFWNHKLFLIVSTTHHYCLTIVIWATRVISLEVHVCGLPPLPVLSFFSCESCTGLREEGVCI